MQKAIVRLLFFVTTVCLAQQSDFKNISFEKADNIAKKTRSRKLLALNELTIKLTKDLDTDVEKVRAIYKWICLNVASDYRLFHKNERLRKKYKNDSVKLAEWNSELKRDLFPRLLNRKKTICTGYAYLFKAMCDVVDIENKMVFGFGRTADVIEFDPKYPNHTWNVVKLNNKWYLCDATWAAGTAYVDRFKFDYNDGYFLTSPELFIYNHYPLNTDFSLLGDKTPSFNDYIEMPLLYGKAYEVFEKPIGPLKMYQEIKRNTAVSFTYQLKKKIDVNKLKIITFNGVRDNSYKPRIEKKGNLITLTHRFRKTGFFDAHLYLGNDFLATYTIKVIE